MLDDLMELARVFMARGDLAHLALFLWAAGGDASARLRAARARTRQSPLQRLRADHRRLRPQGRGRVTLPHDDRSPASADRPTARRNVLPYHRPAGPGAPRQGGARLVRFPRPHRDRLAGGRRRGAAPKRRRPDERPSQLETKLTASALAPSAADGPSRAMPACSTASTCRATASGRAPSRASLARRGASRRPHALAARRRPSRSASGCRWRGQGGLLRRGPARARPSPARRRRWAARAKAPSTACRSAFATVKAPRPTRRPASAT